MKDAWIGERKELSPLQIAGLAIAGSTIAALTTLVVLRRLGVVGQAAESQNRDGRADVRAPDGPPDHFSEDVVVPGLTFTGGEVEAQIKTSGRSPEGV